MAEPSLIRNFSSIAFSYKRENAAKMPRLICRPGCPPAARRCAATIPLDSMVEERCPKCFAQLFYTPPLGPSPGWSPCRCGRLGSMPQDHRPRRRRRECTSRRGGRWDGCGWRAGVCWRSAARGPWSCNGPWAPWKLQSDCQVACQWFRRTAAAEAGFVFHFAAPSRGGFVAWSFGSPDSRRVGWTRRGLGCRRVPEHDVHGHRSWSVWERLWRLIRPGLKPPEHLTARIEKRERCSSSSYKGN